MSFAIAPAAEDGVEMPHDEDFAHDADRFAKALDAISISRPTPSEKRAELFRLAELYYQYAADQVNALSDSLHNARTTRLRRSEDVSSQDSMEVDDNSNGIGVHDDDVPAIRAALNDWEQEAQTWDMLRRLLPLRYPSAPPATATAHEASKFHSTAALWHDFLESDLVAQERKAVLEALQHNADETRPDIDTLVHDYQQRADRGDIIAFGWLHTKAEIKKQKTTKGWSGALDPNTSDASQLVVLDSSKPSVEPLVTQLDPDVATRQARKLQPQDEYFERAIWLGCFELLRRGRSLSEIRDWCVERTEVWRAVSMSAMPLSKDGDEAKRGTADPLSTLLWRRTSFALARQGGSDDYERAVYGILSGDISSVEKVCQTWDDIVFAHYNALLRTQFDSYIIKRSPHDATAAVTQSLPAFDAVQFHGDAASLGERLMRSLESNPKTSTEARTPIKALQAAIVSNNLSQYIYDFGLVLGKSANEHETSALIPDFGFSKGTVDTAKFFRLDSTRGLRILVHTYLLVSDLDELQNESNGQGDHSDWHKTQENVLSAYVSSLRLNNMNMLLPLYCSKLHGDRAFFTLSRNVSKLGHVSDRDTMLKIMSKLGMDIAKFVLFQPESLFQQYPDPNPGRVSGALSVFSKEPPTLKYGRPLRPDFLGDIPDELDTADEQLVQSLEWFLLVDGLWTEVFQVGTRIYKRFLKNLNLHAARAVADRVRCSEIYRRKAGISIGDDDDTIWFEEVRAGVENGTFADSGLSEADIAVSRNYFEMECLVRTLDSMETIASSEGLSRDPTEELGRDFWSSVGKEVKLVKSLVQPLLDNWLLESIEEDDEYDLLRETYLPETILGYVSVLHFAGTCLSRDNLLECMELAALVAKKDADVASVLMTSGRMKELLEGLANCSKALAISANEKKGTGVSSKRMREMGWTRELWSV